MKNIRPTTEADVELCRKMCYAGVWVQAAVSMFMMSQTVNMWVYAVLAVLVLAALILLHKGEEHCACRVIARVIVGLSLPVIALVLLEAVAAAIGGTVLSWCYAMSSLCIVGVPVLSCLLIAAARLCFRRGRYDRVIACLCQTVLTALVAIVTQTDSYQWIIWAWDHDKVRLVWLAIVAITAILVWLYAFVRPTDVTAVSDTDAPAAADDDMEQLAEK